MTRATLPTAGDETATSQAPGEQIAQFPCFGSECTVIVAGRPGDTAQAVAMARRQLLHWHQRFSRFRADSELSALNSNLAATVAVTPMMRRLVAAAVQAAAQTGGLVDCTLATNIEHAGYTGHFEGEGLALERALALAPRRSAARPARAEAQITVDRAGGTVTRSPGVRIDLGGIAKGVFADELATVLSGFDAYGVDCAGDLRVGGGRGLGRDIHVASPFDEATLHTFRLAAGAVATSGIGRRSWMGAWGRPAHHLLDPSTGEPAFTGVVQASALAPTATEAEWRSKAAVLSGPSHGAKWLAHGGVLVFDDASHVVIEPSSRE